jgi:hypothetical protein
MHKLLTVAAMALAGPAWSQTSWTADQFTVSTDNMTDVSIVGGSVVVQDLPTLLALSNPASDIRLPATVFDLDFAPRAGYVLAGEQVTFSVSMNVGTYDAAASFLSKALGSFTVDVNGQYSLSESSDGGVASYDGSYFLGNPNLVAQAVGSTTEGAACPAADAANDCNFGVDLVFQDATVELASFSVTPILSAVPEPSARAAWLAGLALLCTAGALTRSRGRRPGVVR